MEEEYWQDNDYYYGTSSRFDLQGATLPSSSSSSPSDPSDPSHQREYYVEDMDHRKQQKQMKKEQKRRQKQLKGKQSSAPATAPAPAPVFSDVTGGDYGYGDDAYAYPYSGGGDVVEGMEHQGLMVIPNHGVPRYEDVYYKNDHPSGTQEHYYLTDDPANDRPLSPVKGDTKKEKKTTTKVTPQGNRCGRGLLIKYSYNRLCNRYCIGIAIALFTVFFLIPILSVTIARTVDKKKDAACRPGVIKTIQEPELELTLGGFTHVVSDAETFDLARAVSMGYNSISGGCEDALERWMFDAMLMDQILVDFPIPQASSDGSGRNYSTALVVTFSTKISCDGCSEGKAFASIYPPSYGRDIVDPDDILNDASVGGRRHLEHLYGGGPHHSKHVSRRGRLSTTMVHSMERRELPETTSDSGDLNAGDIIVEIEKNIRKADLDPNFDTVTSVSIMATSSSVAMQMTSKGKGSGKGSKKSSKKGSSFDFNPCQDPIPTEAPSSAKGSSKGKGSSSSKGKGFEQPSSAPSCVPSTAPSEPIVDLIPSTGPTIVPSGKPSASPSKVPSVSPSDTPSQIPSVSPSDIPSQVPSISPSETPSQVPTVSNAPSTKPSSAPSRAPSVMPSVSPTGIPSSVPSSTPTENCGGTMEPCCATGGFSGDSFPPPDGDGCRDRRNNGNAFFCLDGTCTRCGIVGEIQCQIGLFPTGEDFNQDGCRDNNAISDGMGGCMALP